MDSYAFDRLKQYTLTPRATPFFGATRLRRSVVDRGPDDRAALVRRSFARRERRAAGPARGFAVRRSAITPPEPRDRTLQSVFTHDHFGPSTHQQIGLYAALIIEPKDTRWSDSETGAPLGNRLAQAFAPAARRLATADPQAGRR